MRQKTCKTQEKIQTHTSIKASSLVYHSFLRSKGRTKGGCFNKQHPQAKDLSHKQNMSGMKQRASPLKKKLSRVYFKAKREH